MRWHNLSPAILTLLIFLLAQGLGTVLLVATGLLNLSDFSISFDSPLFPIIQMAVNVFAILACHFLLHNIRLVTAEDLSAIKWRPGLLGIAGGLVGATSISVLTDDMELPDTLMQFSLAMSHSIWGLLALVIVGPVTEELLFREALEGEMLRRGTTPWPAILVSAVAFGVIHLNLAQALYALPLGIIFGIIYYKTGSIILTSLLHILNNGIVVAQLRILGEDMADSSCAEWLGSTAWVYAFMILSGILCLLLMKKFWDYCPPPQRKYKT